MVLVWGGVRCGLGMGWVRCSLGMGWGEMWSWGGVG